MITCVFENKNTAYLRHLTVNVFIFNKERTKVLLIKRSRKYSEPNKWGPAGGFMGRNETTEQCAMREAEEETGHYVQIFNLLRINDLPDRPKEDRQNVDIIYLGEATAQNATHDDEISDIKWFDINHLPSFDEFAFDHAENMRLCLQYFKKPFSIPIIGKVPEALTLA